MAAIQQPRTPFSSLSDVTQQIFYKSMVSYLPTDMGKDIASFNLDPLNEQFYIDTGYCVTKRKTYNCRCLYDTFAEYCDMDGKQVKEALLKFLEKENSWFVRASAACLGMRSINFTKWLQKLKNPRTWPDEYALYGLCVLFRRNAVVITSGRPWTSMQVPDGLSFDSVIEMCETRFLYLDNNLFATLRRRPFTITRPIEFNLKDMQKMRPLHQDRVEGTLHIEMRTDSDYECLVNPDEISYPMEQKPELLPEVPTLSIFDVDYVPDYLPDQSIVKTEPVDYGVIGEIINQPSHIAKEIKQELLDNAAKEVVKRHSTECALTKFVTEKQNDIGLRIEDVHSLVTAEKASRPTETASLPVVASTPEPVPVVTPTPEPVPVVTSTVEPDTRNNLEPLPVVSTTTQPLPVVTTTHTVTASSKPLDTDTTTKPLPVVTANRTAVSCSGTLATEFTSQATLPERRPVTCESSELCEEIAEHSKQSDTTLNKLVSGASVSHVAEPTLLAPHVYRYYDVLNVMQDDIVSISHEELVTRTCDVSLDRLSQSDIEDIQSYLKGNKCVETEAGEDDVIKDPKKKVKRRSHRPLRKPSKERIHAQKIIQKRNEQIRKKVIKPSPLRVDKPIKPAEVASATKGYR